MSVWSDLVSGGVNKSSLGLHRVARCTFYALHSAILPLMRPLHVSLDGNTSSTYSIQYTYNFYRRLHW